ncbi:MAG: hypothetical protein GY765_16300 [bacterium]|nr:hypothetical protein [bacterium]
MINRNKKKSKKNNGRLKPAPGRHSTYRHPAVFKKTWSRDDAGKKRLTNTQRRKNQLRLHTDSFYARIEANHQKASPQTLIKLCNADLYQLDIVYMITRGSVYNLLVLRGGTFLLDRIYPTTAKAKAGFSIFSANTLRVPLRPKWDDEI